MPAAEQATVFEKFRQGGDALTRPPGTGLGLPISRQIVDHFGGTMWLESEPGRGACFAFRLPLRPGGETTMGTKVLIADDEPNIVVSLEFMMKREGYEVLVARDGTQALETIRARAAAPGAARRDDAGHDRLRRLRGGARRRRACATPAS